MSWEEKDQVKKGTIGENIICKYHNKNINNISK